MSQTTFFNWIQTGWRVHSCFLSYSNYILDYKYKHSSFYLTVPKFFISVIFYEKRRERLKQWYNFIQLKIVPFLLFFLLLWVLHHKYFICIFYKHWRKRKKSKRLPESIIINIIVGFMHTRVRWYNLSEQLHDSFFFKHRKCLMITKEKAKMLTEVKRSAFVWTFFFYDLSRSFICTKECPH